MSKNPMQSKTILFNALYVLLSIAGVFGWGGFTPDPKTLEISALIIGVINLYLRFKTADPIRWGVWRN